ncbi:MAG: DUF2243 domain-containing protein [Rhodobacterales bacterium]
MEQNINERQINTSHQALTRRRAWGGFLIGVAIGGFFDGILLHQILQWHHLLSGVAGSETVLDLRVQILADGLFHLAHYIFALVGAWLLWSARSRPMVAGAGHHLLGWALIGFGAWHVTDAVLAHWVLQLHRIRMDVDNPLLWDLLWFVPFGLGAGLAGLWLLRKPPSTGGGALGSRSVTVGLCLIAGIAGPLAARPPADLNTGDRTLAVFRPGVSFEEIEAAADRINGRLVWTDIRQGVWLIAHDPDVNPLNLYRYGAMVVTNGAVSIGCASWSEV